MWEGSMTSEVASRSHPPQVRIDRLRIADLANLWAESPGMPSQIALLARFDAGPFRDGQGRFAAERVRAELARRVRRVPALTRRVLWTHRGEGRPVWVRDPQFDPAHHITHASFPPGEDLIDWSADRVVRPLDRERPLWRAEVIDGLPDGRFGLLVVVHHAVADGLTGVAIMTALFDPDPVTPAVDPPPDQVAPPPGRRALVADQLTTLRTSLGAAARRLPHLPQDLRRAARQVCNAAGDVRAPAPATSLPSRVGLHRRLAAVHVPLDELRATAHAHHATVNDLLLAAVSAGLRDLLRARGDDVSGLVLRASFPVGELAGQHGGMLLVGLPVGEADPLRRLATITTATTAMKARVRSGGGDVFDILHLPRPLARLAVRWMRRAAHRHINLFVTNVPGPTRPLWLAGARMLDALPVAPLTADVPIGVAALSYDGTLAVCVTAAAALTDLDVLAHGIERGLAELGLATTR
jgi:diacylglycerol O-acyltransferase / wax synthase